MKTVPSKQSINQANVKRVDYASQQSIIVNGDLSPICSEKASPSPLKACANLSADEHDTPASAPHSGIVARQGKVLSFINRPQPSSFLEAARRKEEAKSQNEAEDVDDVESCDADSDEMNNEEKAGKRLLKQHHPMIKSHRSNHFKVAMMVPMTARQSTTNLQKHKQLTRPPFLGPKNMRFKKKQPTNYKEESSEDGIPMPQELSVSQIPLENKSELVPSPTGNKLQNKVQKLSNPLRDSIVTPATATSSLILPEPYQDTSSARISSSMSTFAHPTIAHTPQA